MKKYRPKQLYLSYFTSEALRRSTEPLFVLECAQKASLAIPPLVTARMVDYQKGIINPVPCSVTLWPLYKVFLAALGLTQIFL